jgi:hypothetical protein
VAVILLSCIATFASFGCSLAIDADRQQCADDSECSAYSGSSCVSGICQGATLSSGGGSGSGGASGSGGGKGIGNIPNTNDNDWSCVGKPAKTTPEPGPFTIGMRLANILTTIGGYEKAAAKLCPLLDLDCTTPIKTGLTDADGRVTFEDVTKNLASYVWFTRETMAGEDETSTMVPTIFVFNRHLDRDIIEPPLAVQAVTPALIAGLTGALGAPQIDGNGISLNNVFDCNGKAAADVTFKLVKREGEETDATVFYANGSIPSADLEATTSSGFGGLVNATPGSITVEAYVTELDGVTTHRVANFSFFIKPNTLTLVRLVPSGF